MNKTILMGRLTKDPDTRTTQDGKTVTRYTLAVDRRGKKDEADFISCVAFGKSAEFADKYFHKGMKVLITGEIRTGSYTNKDGQKVYTTDIWVSDQEFCESKKTESHETESEAFLNIPIGMDEELPFGMPER